MHRFEHAYLSHRAHLVHGHREAGSVAKGSLHLFCERKDWRSHTVSVS